MNAKELQAWINARGGNLVVDGAFGPASRKGLIEAFRNLSAPPVAQSDIEALAQRLGCSGRQIKAVASVESGGSGWDNKGLLACLWERHYLFRRVRFAVPGISDPKPGGYTIDADGNGINDSWEKLALATSRFGDALAFECASFGKFQIMGAHWKALDYSSAVDFVWRLSRSEAAHYEAFARYIEANGLTGALRRVDGKPDSCRAIARGYNGNAYERYNYHGKIASAFRALG